MDNGDRLWIAGLLCAVLAAKLPGWGTVSLVTFLVSIGILMLGLIVRGNDADKT